MISCGKYYSETGYLFVTGPVQSGIRKFARVALLAGVFAAASDAVPVSAQVRDPGAEAEKIKELKKRLDQRDAVIRDLMRRVERLEGEAAGRHDHEEN